ncbi:MAG: FUSC family protein [Burkholderiales bacterium]|nr:FUSC family protein [Burkholderiales bacterium]
MKPFHRLPAYALNGLAVASGIGVVQLLIGALVGAHAAQWALSGAVCASLADVPNTVPRTWHRVSAAAVLSFAAALVVAVLKPYPLVLGAGVVGVTFAAMMTMAWGLRAAAVSFAPILSLVFSIAAPASGVSMFELAGWNALGGVVYLAWSLIAGRVLQGRYRTLALEAALRAAARLLPSRAALLESPHPRAPEARVMNDWIKGEAELAERLQSARDFVFVDADSERYRRDTAILLRAIDLRDLLLAGRLDLDVLGRDANGRWLLQRVGQALRRIGQALEAAADAVRDGRPAAPADALQDDLNRLFADAQITHAGVRTRLLRGVHDRLTDIGADVVHIHALLRGGRECVPLTREQLQRFVAAEGWPLKALGAHWSGQSPVLRHAVRAALALGTAYYLALALPWASHPHWLVLSVAVVLRGNLEQTLSRRNTRVLGTMLGCAVVLLLSHLTSPALLSLVFLAAVGIAHSFVAQRYWMTATAATVMALLQSHLVNPAGGFAIAERVADTVLGAALAWGFSYVLPSWERRRLPLAIDQVLKDLRDYAGHALRPQPAAAVEQRLARRRAYDALSALAGALQRSAAEPRAVQLPIRQVAALIDHGQRLMAHLSVVRLMLVRAGSGPAGQTGARALQRANADLAACLCLAGEPAAPAGDAVDAVDADARSMSAPPAVSEGVLPGLVPRLQGLAHDARQVRAAAIEALATVQGARRHAAAAPVSVRNVGG